MADIKIAEKAAREIEQTVFAGLIHRINREKSIAAMAKIVERAIAESRSPQPRNGEYENIPDGRLEPDEHCIPSGYNQCLYCGEPVEAPALYCCEEHEEGRSML
jgi:hypothetical protein